MSHPPEPLFAVGSNLHISVEPKFSNRSINYVAALFICYLQLNRSIECGQILAALLEEKLAFQARAKPPWLAVNKPTCDQQRELLYNCHFSMEFI